MNPFDMYSIFGPLVPSNGCASLGGRGTNVSQIFVWHHVSSTPQVGNQNTHSFQPLIYVNLMMEIHASLRYPQEDTTPYYERAQGKR